MKRAPKYIKLLVKFAFSMDQSIPLFRWAVWPMDRLFQIVSENQYKCCFILKECQAVFMKTLTITIFVLMPLY